MIDTRELVSVLFMPKRKRRAAIHTLSEKFVLHAAQNFESRVSKLIAPRNQEPGPRRARPVKPAPRTIDPDTIIDAEIVDAALAPPRNDAKKFEL